MKKSIIFLLCLFMGMIACTRSYDSNLSAAKENGSSSGTCYDKLESAAIDLNSQQQAFVVYCYKTANSTRDCFKPLDDVEYAELTNCGANFEKEDIDNAERLENGKASDYNLIFFVFRKDSQCDSMFYDPASAYKNEDEETISKDILRQKTERRECPDAPA